MDKFLYKYGMLGALALSFIFAAVILYLPFADIQISKNTTFRYKDTLLIKSGFYRDFKCQLIAEYKDSVFCELQTSGYLRENFPKSNVSFLEHY